MGYCTNGHETRTEIEETCVLRPGTLPVHAWTAARTASRVGGSAHKQSRQRTQLEFKIALDLPISFSFPLSFTLCMSLAVHPVRAQQSDFRFLWDLPAKT